MKAVLAVDEYEVLIGLVSTPSLRSINNTTYASWITEVGYMTIAFMFHTRLCPTTHSEVVSVCTICDPFFSSVDNPMFSIRSLCGFGLHA